MARPKKVVDEKLLENLTKLHLSDQVISDCVGVSVWTLERRYAQQMQEWRSQSKSKIANVLFDEAINKREPWALKALAQKHLNYHDKIKTESTNIHSFGELSDEDLDTKINEKLSKLNESK